MTGLTRCIPSKGVEDLLLSGMPLLVPGGLLSVVVEGLYIHSGVAWNLCWNVRSSVVTRLSGVLSSSLYRVGRVS